MLPPTEEDENHVKCSPWSKTHEKIALYSNQFFGRASVGNKPNRSYIPVYTWEMY
jgi:hypothetical protein